MNTISLLTTVILVCGSSAWSLFGAKACECHCETEVDEGVLSLLRSQLARCGPEQLVRADCPEIDTGTALQQRFVDLAFFVPIAFACGYLYGTRHSYRFISKSVFQIGVEKSGSQPAELAIEDGYEFNIDAPRWSPPTDNSARRVRR